MIKRYSIPTEEKAKELILNLAPQNNKDEVQQKFKKITVTEHTHGIVCLGFQDKCVYNVDTEESVLIKKGLTYDIDVFWKDEPLEEWNEFEVNPKTPNHNFA